MKRPGLQEQGQPARNGGLPSGGTVSSMCLLDPSLESGQRPGPRSRFGGHQHGVTVEE